MNNLKTKNLPAGIPGVSMVRVSKEDRFYEELSKKLGAPVKVRSKVVERTSVVDAVGPLRSRKGQAPVGEDVEIAIAERNCDIVIELITTASAAAKQAFLKKLVGALDRNSPEDLKSLASAVLGTENGTDALQDTLSEMKKTLRQAESNLKQTENRACRAENTASSLERKLAESESLRQGYVRRIAELEKNLAAAKDENTRLSEELVVAARNNAPTPEKDESALLDEYLKLEQENAELKAQVAAKDAMLSGITSGSDGCSCGLNVPERELAPGELKALLVTLASERLSRMSDSSRRTTEHRRLLDLLSAIVSNNPVPESYLEFCRSVHGLKGSSKQTAYVREMLRLGFEEQNNPGTHRKFYFRGDERYCTMQGVSPSDVKAMDNSTHQIELMLLIPGAESVSGNAETNRSCQ